MFNQLSDTLQGTFKKISGQGKLRESNITDALQEVRMALLEADVDLTVAKNFIQRVKEKALGESVIKSVSPGQQIIKIFNDELTLLLGGDNAPIDLSPPANILIVGLNGAGKTTTSAKLALHLQKQGRRPALIACDLIRPAAIDQLVTLGEQNNIPVYAPSPKEKNVLKVAKQGAKWAQQQGATITIFDTAGRQEVDKALLEELHKLHAQIKPTETLLVADSATGQQAVDVAKSFHEKIPLSGLILTRLDGDARGGAALSMREVTQVPIKFAGVGEKIEDLESFHPDRMAGRILGMGDVVGLVEKASEVVEEEQAARMAKRMEKGKFDFEDFLEQFKMMRKLGPLENLLGMLPGVGSKMKNMNIDEKHFKHLEAIILSMTPKERRRPELINGRRRKRIANGSGRNIPEVNKLLKQFRDMRKIFGSKSKLKQVMAQMGGMGGDDSPFGGGGMPPGGMGGNMPKGLGF